MINREKNNLNKVKPIENIHENHHSLQRAVMCKMKSLLTQAAKNAKSKAEIFKTKKNSPSHKSASKIVS